MRLAAFFTRLVGVCGLALVIGLFAGGLDAQTAADKNKDKAKTTAKAKQKDRDEDQLTAQILKYLEGMFKKEDINGNGELDKPEVLTWLGLAHGPAFLKKYDTDSSSSISKEEFAVWASEYSRQEAIEMIREEAELEAAIQKYQEALAKASAQAKAQYQQQIDRYRQQQNRQRYDQRFRNRYRR